MEKCHKYIPNGLTFTHTVKNQDGSLSVYNYKNGWCRIDRQLGPLPPITQHLPSKPQKPDDTGANMA